MSRGTVTRVLNDQRYVSEAARQAVLDACLVVGYVPNRAARNLATARSHVIGFIIQEPFGLMLADPNIGQILLGANSVASQADYQLVNLVVDSDRDRERVERYLTGGYADGVIALSSRQHDQIIGSLQAMGVPTVVIGRPPDELDLPHVHIDNRGASEQIVQRLVGTGRRRIAIVVAATDRDSGADRLEGYRDALGEQYLDALVERVPLYDFSAGRDGAIRLLERVADVDAIFATSDALAAGVIDGLRMAGRTPGRDIAVVGFDDSAWAERCEPALSTVHQPAKDLGATAAELLLSLLGDRQPVDDSSVLLPTHIVWRDSAPEVPH